MQPICHIKGIFPVYLASEFDYDALQDNYCYIVEQKNIKLYKKNPMWESFTNAKLEKEDQDLIRSSLLGTDPFLIYQNEQLVGELSPEDVAKTDFGKTIINNKIGDKEFKNECTFTLPKIPAKVIEKVVNFFRAVFFEHHAEACAYLLLKDGEWDLEIPEQKVTYSSVKYDPPESSDVVGTIHSHCDFGNFFSGTDNDDDFSFDGVHITAGHIVSDVKFSCSIASNKTRFTLTPDQILEDCKTEVLIPEEWMKKVSKQSYQSNGTAWVYDSSKKKWEPPTPKKKSDSKPVKGFVPCHVPSKFKKREESEVVNTRCSQCKAVYQEKRSYAHELQDFEIKDGVKFGGWCNKCALAGDELFTINSNCDICDKVDSVSLYQGKYLCELCRRETMSTDSDFDSEVRTIIRQRMELFD